MVNKKAGQKRERFVPDYFAAGGGCRSVLTAKQRRRCKINRAGG